MPPLDLLFGQDYWLARFLFQRGLAVIYLIAFVVAVKQFLPLLGKNGLLPSPRFLQSVNFTQAPSLFHFYYSDKFFQIISWLGLAISVVLLLGLSEALPWWGASLLWLVVWAIYLSIVNIGQSFYSFGWETMLLEAGFLVIFLGNNSIAAPWLVIFLLRWMLFRVEFGAGMIKIRGDDCWRNLTCLKYHHETQPMPGPFSWYFHHLPARLHKIETLGNHFFQLVVPWGLFFPQPIAAIAGSLIIVSQLWLVVSGNFSWLNWLTIILALSTFPNSWLIKILPLDFISPAGYSPLYQAMVVAVVIVFIILSWRPLRNLFSRHQLMNASFNNWHLSNTYGAFGSVTKKRYEIVLEGTNESIITEQTLWLEYGFKGKPGDLFKRPAQFAPYHLRLDWLMWFQAFNPPGYYSDWFAALVEKLLQNDKATINLLRSNPFPDQPPRFIRAQYYLYRFTTPAEKKNSGTWWKRELLGEYLAPISLEKS